MDRKGTFRRFDIHADISLPAQKLSFYSIYSRYIGLSLKATLTLGLTETRDGLVCWPMSTSAIPLYLEVVPYPTALLHLDIFLVLRYCFTLR